jgi:hypothetical protein
VASSQIGEEIKRQRQREADFKKLQGEIDALKAANDGLVQKSTQIQSQSKALSAIHSEEESKLRMEMRAASERFARIMVSLHTAMPQFEREVEKLPKDLKADVYTILADYIDPQAPKLCLVSSKNELPSFPFGTGFKGTPKPVRQMKNEMKRVVLPRKKESHSIEENSASQTPSCSADQAASSSPEQRKRKVSSKRIQYEDEDDEY